MVIASVVVPAAVILFCLASARNRLARKTLADKQLKGTIFGVGSRVITQSDGELEDICELFLYVQNPTNEPSVVKDIDIAARTDDGQPIEISYPQSQQPRPISNDPGAVFRNVYEASQTPVQPGAGTNIFVRFILRNVNYDNIAVETWRVSFRDSTGKNHTALPTVGVLNAPTAKRPETFRQEALAIWKEIHTLTWRHGDDPTDDEEYSIVVDFGTTNLTLRYHKLSDELYGLLGNQPAVVELRKIVPASVASLRRIADALYGIAISLPNDIPAKMI